MPPTAAWARRLFTACCQCKCMNPLIWACWTAWGCKNQLLLIPSINYLFINVPKSKVLFLIYSNFEWTKMKNYICSHVLYKNIIKKLLLSLLLVICHLCGDYGRQSHFKAAQMLKTSCNHMYFSVSFLLFFSYLWSKCFHLRRSNISVHDQVRYLQYSWSPQKLCR